MGSASPGANLPGCARRSLFGREEVFLGGQLAHKIERRLPFNPNFESVLVERGALLTSNADFLYGLPDRNRTVFWVSGGFTF